MKKALSVLSTYVFVLWWWLHAHDSYLPRGRLTTARTDSDSIKYHTHRIYAAAGPLNPCCLRHTVMLPVEMLKMRKRLLSFPDEEGIENEVILKSFELFV